MPIESKSDAPILSQLCLLSFEQFPGITCLVVVCCYPASSFSSCRSATEEGRFVNKF